MDTSAAPAPGRICAVSEVARWIGLADASLLGTQPIVLKPKTVAKLEQFGPEAELAPQEVARILKVTPNTVTVYTADTRAARLGHRLNASNQMFVPAADLAAFITHRAKPPVPTTGKAPQIDQAAHQAAAKILRDQFGLPAA